MKKTVIVAMLAFGGVVPVWAQDAPDTFEEKLSYSMGYEVGNYFKRAGGDIQREYLITGIEDAYGDAEPKLSTDEMLTVKKEFATKMRSKQMAQLEEMKTKNKNEGEKYLDENSKKEGVVVTDSGLQYSVLKEGSGDTAELTDTVTVEYTGTLIDGKEFDSTAKHGEPATFQVDQVIPGWSEALQLMSVGSKLRLAIPADLAYGEQGAAPMIEPNSVLLFDVELLSIDSEEKKQ